MGSFENLEAFLAMGGYAVFVWSSYAITALVMVLNVIAPLVQARRVRASLARRRKLAERQR